MNGVNLSPRRRPIDYYPPRYSIHGAGGLPPFQPSHPGRASTLSLRVRKPVHAAIASGGGSTLNRFLPLIFGAIFAALAWPYPASTLLPQPGLDPSWEAALAMAAHARLPFGTRVVFAYGPLGFLTVWPAYFRVTTALAFAFLFLVSLATFASLIWLLGRSLPKLLAVALAYFTGTAILAALAVRYTGIPELLLGLVFAVVVAIMAQPTDDPALSAWLGIALGAAAGFELLIKPSVGVSVTVVLLFAAAWFWRKRRRFAAELAGGALPVLLIGWFTTGNGFDNLIAFVRGTVEIVGGYSSALGREQPGRGFSYWLAAVSAIGIFSLCIWWSRRLPGRRRAAVLVLTLFVVWLLFKEAFVRHDIFHDPVFYGCLLPVFAAFLADRRGIFRTTGVMLLSGAMLCLDLGGVPALVGRPDVGWRNFADGFSVVAQSSQFASYQYAARGELQSQYLVPVDMLTVMAGQTVDVDPWEQTVVWAYPQLRFDPLPGLQDFTTYTSKLDELDVRYLGTRQAPRFILRQLPAAFDNRDPAFEPPATQVAIDCRYRQVAASFEWQLLERGPDRCATPQLVSTARFRLGQWIPVPNVPAGHALLARFELPTGWWSRVRNFFFKSPDYLFSVNGGVQSFRFVPATATDLHLLAPSSTLGYAASFTPAPVTSLELNVAGASSVGAGGLVVRFYSMAERAE